MFQASSLTFFRKGNFCECENLYRGPFPVVFLEFICNLLAYGIVDCAAGADVGKLLT
jgi:hypothetical protein